MKRTLVSEGIINRNLFHVQGELVETYNAALESLTGKRTALTSFHIDKRGESAEVEAELGKNVLQCSSSHRFVIIVSPDQQSAGLIHDEFSFDNEILNKLYEDFMPSISVATRLDGLYGELNDSVRAYYDIEDLLLLNSVSIALKSTSGFLEKAIDTQKLLSELKNDPEKLIDNDSQTVKALFDLAKKVGDIRGFSELIPVHANHPVMHFYTRLFNGAYVFRKNTNGTFMADPTDEKKKPELIPGMTPESITVIFNDADRNEPPESDPKVIFIPMSNHEAVITFLLKNHLVIHAETLIEKKLSAIEDTVLLDKGIRVSDISYEERTRELSGIMPEMPPIWQGLIDIKRKHARGKDLAGIECSAETRGLILQPSAPDKTLNRMVCHLLTRLFPYNYEWLMQYNTHDLEKLFYQSSDLAQEYLVATLDNYC